MNGKIAPIVVSGQGSWCSLAGEWLPLSLPLSLSLGFVTWNVFTRARTKRTARPIRRFHVDSCEFHERQRPAPNVVKAREFGGRIPVAAAAIHTAGSINRS